MTRKWPVPAGVLWAVGRRPGLWRTAVRQALVMRPDGGWSPPPEYLSFRLETAYGDPDARPRAEDVVSWLQWCATVSKPLGVGGRSRRGGHRRAGAAGQS